MYRSAAVRPTARTLLLAGLALALLAVLRPLAAHAQESAQNTFTLLLPFVTLNGAGGNTQPPPPAPRKAVFLETSQKIGTGSLVADGQGGLHTAYAHIVPIAEHPQAVYEYCAPGADCGQAASWSGVVLADNVLEVQLAVTAAGQPRLLIRTQSAQTGYDSDYLYAACDQACTNPAHWDSTFVVSTYGTSMFTISDFTSPQRYFALDPQGRPRFVYFDRNYFIEPDHIGVFYVYCDADCATNPEGDPHWFETQISLAQDYQYEVFKYPALAFTPQGEPRVLADAITLNSDDSGIYYVACDQACEDGANWQRVPGTWRWMATAGRAWPTTTAATSTAVARSCTTPGATLAVSMWPTGRAWTWSWPSARASTRTWSWMDWAGRASPT